MTYHVAYGMWKKTDSRRAGVFVTGTDTGIGKTLVSAILARAWNADYWKPVQTGVAEEPGDTDTVAGLAQLPPERLHLPAAGAAVALGGRAAGRRRAGRHHHRAAGHRRAADRGRRRRPVRADR